MATYTTNLGLKKPAQSDKIRIADINNNMDDIDAAFGAVGDTPVATQLGDIRSGMAIVSTGNAHDAIAAGQFVYVMGHDTLDDGLYTADSALAANATLSSSNVTAVSGGGLNALNSKIANIPIAGTRTDLETLTSGVSTSYTATADCWVSIRSNTGSTAGNLYSEIKIGNNHVVTNYTPSATAYSNMATAPIFIKSGTSITATALYPTNGSASLVKWS